VTGDVTQRRQAVASLVAETLESVAPDDAGVDESTVLLGRLDSLGLVTLIVDLEERLQDELGLPVALGTERALSQRHSPFRTVGTLTDYILELAGEARGDGRS
jgi:acyl carrier protein